MNATQTSTRQRTTCLRCRADLPLEGRLWLGEIVHCGACNAQYEVVDLEPLRVGPRVRIEEEEEDFADWT